MMKFGNIGVFVGFQGDTQLRKIRTQISFSLVPAFSQKTTQALPVYSQKTTTQNADTRRQFIRQDDDDT
jgi:hypothetical protein